MQNKGILDGITVLDMGRYISAPYCGMMLADMGADVIKIEKLGGEDARNIGPFKNGQTLYFPDFNRNKRSLCFDFRAPDAREIFEGLVKKADVIVENFRPGTLTKMGLSDERLLELNPRIIIAHISGYGQSGRYSNRLAFDWIVQAMGGIMNLTGTEESGPTVAGLPMCDHLASIYSAYGIAMSLFEREKTGKGRSIDIGLLDCVVSILQTYIPDYDQTGKINQLTGYRDPLLAPVSRLATKDGYVYIHAGTPAVYARISQLVGGVLLDEKYKDTQTRIKERDIVEGALEAWTKQHTSKEVDEICAKESIPCGIVNDMKAIVESEHLAERGTIVEVPVEGVGMVKYPGPAVKFSDTPAPVFNGAPKLGADDDVILKEIGFSAEKIAELRSKGVI